jgi:hypothetical protein
MASKRQNAANRRNARRSTGPRTEEGRRASSLNALKHGLRSQLVVIPGENPADFQTLFDAFAEEAAPESARDLAAVRKIASCEWRLRRIAALEAEMFTQALQAPMPTEKPTIDNIEAIMERLAAEEDAPPKAPMAILAARFLSGEIKHFNALTRYEATLDRQYQQAWRDLDSRPEPDFHGIYDPAEGDEPQPEPPYTQPTPEAVGWKSAADRYAEANPTPNPAETPINTAPPAHSPETAQTKPIPKSDTGLKPPSTLWVVPFPARTSQKEDNDEKKPESAA